MLADCLRALPLWFPQLDRSPHESSDPAAVGRSGTRPSTRARGAIRKSASTPCTRTDPEQGNRIDPESVGRLLTKGHAGAVIAVAACRPTVSPFLTRSRMCVQPG